MKIIFNIIKVILIGYAIYYLSNVDFSKIILMFGVEQVFAILCLLVFHYFRVLRFHGISSLVDVNISLSNSMRAYYIGLAFAIVTPARMGELYRVRFMNEIGIPSGKAWKVFIIEKFTDAVSLLSFVMIAIAGITLNYNLFFIVPIAVALSLLFIFSVWNFFSIFLKKKAIEDPLDTNSVYGKIKRFSTELLQVDYVKVFSLYIKTFTGWIFFLLSFWIGIYPVHTFKVLELILVYVLNSIAVSLPISFMGYGLRESLLDAVLYSGSNQEYIVAAITMQFTIFYVVSIFIGLLVYFLRRM
jgi:uncharacterized membrane protein YbhN (UPF0104 family)